MKKSLLAALVISMVGCTGTKTNVIPAPELAAIKQAKCCTTLPSVHYQELTESNRIKLVVDKHSQVANFSSGDSFVSGVKLPYSNSPIEVTIDAPVERRTIFIPSLLILDDQYQPVDALDSSQLEYRPSNLIDKRGYTGTIVLPTRYVSGSRPAYILVFTTQDDQQNTTPIEKPSDMAIQAGDTEANIAHNTNYELRHSPTGSVHLTFNLERRATIDEQVERENKVAGYMNTKVDKGPQKTREDMYHNSIKQAVEEGDFTKAMGYVEEAEKEGISRARETFISAMKHYQE